MRTRLSLLLAAPLVLAALAGCGGGGGPDSGGGSGQGGALGGGGGSVGAAAVIPGNVPLVVSVNTDSEGDQATTLNALLAKFPGKDKLLPAIEKSLNTGNVKLADIQAALGPELDLVFLELKSGNSQALVGLTQPKDAAKLNAIFAKDTKSPTFHEEIDGWTVFADSQALLTRFKQAATAGKLADNAAYKEALDSLPKDRLLGVYLDGAAASKSAGSSGGSIAGIGKLRWLAGGVNATDSGIGLEFHAAGDGLKVQNFTSELLGQIPSGSLAVLLFDNLKGTIEGLSSVPQLQKSLGSASSALGQVSSLLGGEGALYVRAGSPLPEVTIALVEQDPSAALATLDGLLKQASKTPPTSTQVAGVGEVKQISVSGVPIYYGAVDNRVIVTTTPLGFTSLKDSGTKLADDPIFTEIKDAAGMPDDRADFLYLNLKDLVPLIQNFAQLSGQKVSPELFPNLAPLRAFVFYASADGDTVTAKGFLEIK